MKKLLILLPIALTITFVNACNSGSNTNEIWNDSYGIYGLVKDMNQISYKLTEEEKRGGQETHHSSNEEFGRDQHVQFDINGYLIKKTTLHSNSKYDVEYSYHYNDLGLLELMEEFQNSRKIFYTVFSYDNSKRLIKKSFYYCFDSNKESLERVEKYNYSSDGENLKTEVSGNDYSQGIAVGFVLIHDNSGKILQEYYLSDYGSISGTTEYSYDDKGNLIKTQYLKDMEIIWNKTYIYNNKGYLIDDGEFQYDYEYDSHGNWVKKILIIEGSPSFITERDFQYYSKSEVNDNEKSLLGIESGNENSKKSNTIIEEEKILTMELESTFYGVTSINVPNGKMWTPLYFKVVKADGGRYNTPFVYQRSLNSNDSYTKDGSYKFPEESDFVSNKVSKQTYKPITGEGRYAVGTNGYDGSVVLELFFLEEGIN